MAPSSNHNAISAAATSNSQTTSLSSTPISTPGLNPSEGPQPQNTSNSSLPPLMKDYPKPSGDVDIAEALARKPGRWTIKGQMDANQRRNQQADNEAKAKQKRAMDFEATKRDLLASKNSLGL